MEFLEIQIQLNQFINGDQIGLVFFPVGFSLNIEVLIQIVFYFLSETRKKFQIFRNYIDFFNLNGLFFYLFFFFFQNNSKNKIKKLNLYVETSVACFKGRNHWMIASKNSRINFKEKVFEVGALFNID